MNTAGRERMARDPPSNQPLKLTAVSLAALGLAPAA